MSEIDIYNSLTKIFHDVFMRDNIVLSPSLSANDVPGWDSFKQIEIILAVEEYLSVNFTTKELDGLQNVGDLADLIRKKLKTD